MADDSELEAASIDDDEYRRSLEQALDSLGTGVVLTRNGQVVYASETLERLIGYSLSELRDVDVMSLVDDDELGEIAARVQAARRGVHEPATFDVRARHRSGRTIDLYVANAPLAGPVVNLSLVRDVTEERALQRRSEQAHRMEAIGQLCSGIAHDLNNYLTAVRLIGESLATANETERAALLAELEEVTAGAGRLTHQLQTFGGGDGARSVVLDINLVVFEMAAMLRRVTGRHIELALNLEPGLPLTRINAAQLQQVIVNLVVNAGHAIGSRGGRVTLQTQAEGEVVALTVRDDGCGMDPQTLGRAFEPLFSTHPETAPGMGLAIVYGIARQCGGEVDIKTEPGRGTAVCVRLPVTNRVSRSSRESAPIPAHDSTLEVLIVEGVAKLGLLVEAGLRREGFHVHRATIEDADQMMSSRPFDAMVVDVEPPGDPVAAVRRFRTRHPHGRVVFVSQPPPIDDSEWDSGALLLVPKPFSVAEIAAAIRHGAA